MISYKDELYHHGVKGQKWGVRRYQNADGSLTGAGQRRYNRFESKMNRKISRSEKHDAKISAFRSKNRAKLEAKYDKKIQKTQADIDSFDPIKNGLTDNKGRTILSADDVSGLVKGLQDRVQKLQAKKEHKLNDFDDGTRFVEQGAKHYNDVMKNYRDAKLSSFVDSGYKKSPEYKAAVKKYVGQLASDAYYGYSSATKLDYTHAIANKYYKDQKSNG